MRCQQCRERVVKEKNGELQFFCRKLFVRKSDGVVAIICSNCGTTVPVTEEIAKSFRAAVLVPLVKVTTAGRLPVDPHPVGQQTITVKG